MPSFDIVSKVDHQEVDNAVNSVRREIETRFDFKGGKSSIEWKEGDSTITLLADDDTKHKAIVDMLKTHIVKRKLDPKVLDFKGPETASGNMVREDIAIKEGIGADEAKKLTKEIKGSKLKVQATIRGDELRITGKKRDDLQVAIQHVKEMNLDTPLQFINFRD